MKNQIQMPAVTLFPDAQSVPAVDAPKCFFATMQQDETLPVKAGEGELTYFFLGISVLILLLLLIGAILICRLGHQETPDGLMQQHTGEEMTGKEALTQATPACDEFDSEALLYKRLCALMEDQHLFKNAQLNREMLSERLGTNHVYLAKAIRRYAQGMTVGEFINEARLTYSASLLANRPDLTIDEIKQMSGFNSRTTFGRLFRERYGMSPTKYRIMSK